jgi:hypothetical protein
MKFTGHWETIVTPGLLQGIRVYITDYIYMNDQDLAVWQYIVNEYPDSKIIDNFLELMGKKYAKEIADLNKQIEEMEKNGDL